MTEYQTITADSDVYRDGTIKLHGPEGFEGMRKAGRLAADILDQMPELVQPGVTTQSIDDAIRGMMLDAGAVPATLGYRGYTHSSCISVNHVICHGIPSEKTLKDGDIVNIDVTPLLDGWHGDTSRMFFAGDPPLKAKKLVEATHEALMIGIEAAGKPGARLGDIGAAIEAHAKQRREIDDALLDEAALSLDKPDTLATISERFGASPQHYGLREQALREARVSLPDATRAALAELRRRVALDQLPLLSLLQADPLLMQSSHLSFQEYFAARALCEEGPVLTGPPPWRWPQLLRPLL